MRFVAALLLATSVLMNGCVTTGTGTAGIPERVKARAELMERCPETLSKLEGLTGADALRAHSQDAATYKECMTRFHELQDFQRAQDGN
jgi:hypothetical protein